FSNNYWQVQQLFMQANRFEELIQLFDEVDLRKLGSYWMVSQAISSMLQQEKSKELGLKLFRKAWEAFPQNRGYILGYLHNDEIWRLPEIYSFAKEAVVPREDAEPDSWQGMNETISYGQDGHMQCVVTQLLAGARKQQRLPELRAEVQAAL